MSLISSSISSLNGIPSCPIRDICGFIFLDCSSALLYKSLSFSEALAEELRGIGVSVTVLCPGATASGFQSRAKMEDSRLVSGRKLMNAAMVARAGYRGLMRNKTVVVPGLVSRMYILVVRLLPRSIVTRAVKNMQERVHQ